MSELFGFNDLTSPYTVGRPPIAKVVAILSEDLEERWNVSEVTNMEDMFNDESSFNHDESKIASGSGDMTGKAWNAKTGNVPDELSELLERYYQEEEVGDYYESFLMQEYFHPPPRAQWLTGKFLEDLNWLAKKIEIEFPISRTPRTIQQWLNSAKNRLGLGDVSHFVKTTDPKAQDNCGGQKKKNGTLCYRPSRKTKKAIFKIVERQKRLQGTFSHYATYKRARDILSKLAGRLDLWQDPWVTATAFPIAKVGLMSEMVRAWTSKLSGSWENFTKDYPITHALLAVLWANFSARKEFTIESQKQGSLNPYENELLEMVKIKEPDAYHLLGLALPYKEVFEKLRPEMIHDIYDNCETWLYELAPFLERQWHKGIKKTPKRNNIVLPSSWNSGCNTTGYNVVADAFTNLHRFYKITQHFLKSGDNIFTCKVLQVVAADQASWHKDANGEKHIHHDVLIYRDFTKSHRPWSHWLPGSKGYDNDLVSIYGNLVILVGRYNGNIESWIGLPVMRHTEEVKGPKEMICGVEVPPMQKDTVNFLKRIGIFGSGKWNP